MLVLPYLCSFEFIYQKVPPSITEDHLGTPEEFVVRIRLVSVTVSVVLLVALTNFPALLKYAIPLGPSKSSVS